MRLPALILALGLAAGAPLLHAAATLKPYRNEAELAGALERWRAAAQALQQRQRRESAMTMSAAPPPPAVPAAVAEAAKAGPAADAAGAESITNVQTAGVDEGGIVKRAGEYLVILRRGRLFTVRVGGDQLRPVAMADAYAPGSDPRGAWYDELLVHGSTLVVVGYSYARGGTEIGIFDLASDGAIRHRSTHHLRSFDYYSARNYASRLVGKQLVFYSPTVLSPWGAPWAQMMPAMRRWGPVPNEFERILPATRIHRTDDEFDPREPLALHTITRCELGGDAGLACDSSAVLGPAGRVFYVSAGSVYVWTHSRGREAGGANASVFRLPLDGSAPSGLKTVGTPTDQFSFHEDASGHLNVLLRESGPGEGMGGNARSQGRTALLRVPLDAFGDGRDSAERHHYHRVPGPEAWGMQNRFVGDWLLWGAGDAAWAMRYADPGRSTALQPGHRVERIEALGGQAVLVGNAGRELVFSAVRLQRGEPRLAGRLAHPGARQGESRSHGFFYRATGEEEGLLGLPVLQAGGGAGGASVIVLRNRGLSFTGLGELTAQASPRLNDRCKASCVDWYGNARPIFMGDRVLALMGYELVEGRVRGGVFGESIEELRRTDFGPRLRPEFSNRPTPFE
jgi:hypothetical protein